MSTLIDDKLIELRLNIIKEGELLEHMVKVNMELRELIILKKQQKEKIEVVNRWLKKPRFSIKSFLHLDQGARKARQLTYEKEYEELTTKMLALDQRLNLLLERGQSMHTKLNKIIKDKEEYELLITEKVGCLTDEPDFGLLKRIDDETKAILKEKKPLGEILSIGSQLRRMMLHYRKIALKTKQPIEFELNELPLYQLYTLFVEPGEAFDLKEMMEHVDRLNKLLQPYNVYLHVELPSPKIPPLDTPKDVVMLNAKQVVETMRDWMESFNELNKLIDDVYLNYEKMERKYLDLFQQRHSKILKPVEISEPTL